MKNTDLSIIFLIVLGLTGIILIMIGIFTLLHQINKKNKCSATTYGKVVDYKYPDVSDIYPIVEFFVGGVSYKAKKRFKGVIKVHKPKIKNDVKSNIYEDDRGYLHIKESFVTNLRKMGEYMWPIGSNMKVFYDPRNPKVNYADKYYINKLLFFIFLGIGISSIFLGVLFYFIFK